MFPELTPWVAWHWVAGKPRPVPWPPGAPGRKERMNGLGLQSRGGREPWPGSVKLCAASLARPELFEAFCGCWLLLLSLPLLVLSLSAQTGNLARILLPLHRQV